MTRGISSMAKVYLGSVVTLAGAVCVGSSVSTPLALDQWPVFAVLLVCASVAQMFPVVTPKNQAYYVTTVFLFAGILLLSPSALCALLILAFVPEWVKMRYPWYIQLFNIANFLVDAVVALALYSAIGAALPGALASLNGMIAALLAATAFTIVNHTLLAMMLHLARGRTWKESGLFAIDNLVTDGALACTGIMVALLWSVNVGLIGLIAAPLFLFYRALNTPNLQEMARTDSKTGLYNARHFYEVLREEFRRAQRFERPLAIIMADMDLLRNINNTYGHLAGDVVLKGVADLISAELRDYDVAARFGGEEFSVLLPETDGDQALAVAERVRQAVENARFLVPTSVSPIQATLSLGVASYPAHSSESHDIIHQADLAVYYAKLQGRNKTWLCSPESAALGEGSRGRTIDGLFDAPYESRETPDIGGPATAVADRAREAACQSPNQPECGQVGACSPI